MSRSSSVRAAVSRALVVLVALGATLIGLAGTSLATSVGDPVTADTTASTSAGSFGVSIGTLTWAVVGFTLLVLGFIAASRSGRRQGAVVTTGIGSVGAAGLLQHQTPDAQGQPTSAVATV